MPLDASIILSGKAPQIDNPMDIAQKAMTLRSLSQQNAQYEKQTNEQNTLKDILKRNTVVGPNGEATLNKKGTLSEMFKENPTVAMEYEKKWTAEEADARAQKLSLFKNQTEMQHQLTMAMTPDNYLQLRQQAIDQGLPNAQNLPPQYPGDSALNSMRMKTLTMKEQLDYKLKEQTANLEKDKFTLDKDKFALEKVKTLSPTSGTSLTEGEKAVDKDYAKDYNDFTGGGQSKAVKAIQKLKDYKDEISKDTGFIQAGGGPISGSMPDALRSEKSISRRDNIVSVANSALKATFGGQLSDGERKALANEFYNDKLSNEENLKIIERKITELEDGLADQQAKARHYEKNRSLSKFQSGNGSVDLTKLSDDKLFDLYKKAGGT